MPKVLIHRSLVVRIDQHGLSAELKAFVKACSEGKHPPRIYKPSGAQPPFAPYQLLDLHHHHLHRDGDPLLVTQHVDGVIYGVALATHETYFRQDCMGWLKEHIDAFDWTGLESFRAKVASYDPFGPDADDDEVDREPF
ncbi:MAG: hypothetical protein K2Z80_15660 [Xanthobacteraceae bacterium]|nr:hypothetical protein [Xanthobacteraceae bacterium]